MKTLTLLIFFLPIIAAQVHNCTRLHEEKHRCVKPFLDKLDSLKALLEASFEKSAKKCLADRADKCVEDMQKRFEAAAARKVCREEVQNGLEQSGSAIDKCFNRFKSEKPMIGMPNIAPNPDGSYTPPNRGRGPTIGLPNRAPGANGKYTRGGVIGLPNIAPNPNGSYTTREERGPMIGMPNIAPNPDGSYTPRGRGLAIGLPNRTLNSRGGVIGLPNIAPNPDGSYTPHEERGPMIGMPNIAPNPNGSYTPHEETGPLIGMPNRASNGHNGGIIGLPNIAPNPDGSYTPHEEKGPMIGMPNIAPNSDGSYTPRNYQRGPMIGLPNRKIPIIGLPNRVQGQTIFENGPLEDMHGAAPPGGRMEPPMLPQSCQPINEAEILCMEEAKESNVDKESLRNLLTEMHDACSGIHEEANECRPESEELCNCLCEAKKPMHQKFAACMTKKGVEEVEEPTCECQNGPSVLLPSVQEIVIPPAKTETPFSQAEVGRLINRPFPWIRTVNGVPVNQPFSQAQAGQIINKPFNTAAVEKPFSQAQAGQLVNRPYSWINSVQGQPIAQPFSEAQAGQLINRPRIQQVPFSQAQAGQVVNRPYNNNVQVPLSQAQAGQVINRPHDNNGAYPYQVGQTANQVGPLTNAGHPVNYYAWRNWARNTGR